MQAPIQIWGALLRALLALAFERLIKMDFTVVNLSRILDFVPNLADLQSSIYLMANCQSVFLTLQLNLRMEFIY